VGTFAPVREFNSGFHDLNHLMLTWLQFGDLPASDSDGRGSVDQVEATTRDARVKRDTIQVLVGSSEAPDDDINRAQHRWPERSLLDSQLGPNKNGRKW
jgi:hypothetical protein